MTYYVRWKPGTPRIGERKFDVLGGTPDHPYRPVACEACSEEVRPGHEFVLVACGPDAVDTIKAHDEGKWYAAAAIPVHNNPHCLDGLE